MADRFVVFAEVRTGSYALVSLRDSAPDITCVGEIFHHTQLALPPAYQALHPVTTLEARNAAPVIYALELAKLAATAHVGFKLLNNQLSYVKPVAHYIANPRIKRIILVRDPFDVYASFIRARETNLWKVGHQARVAENKLRHKIHFTPESFEKFVPMYNKFLRRAAYLAQLENSFVIGYDQLNDPQVIDALLQFLGSSASSAQTSISLKKQFTGTLADGIENWQEFQDYRAQKEYFLPLPATTIGPAAS